MPFISRLKNIASIRPALTLCLCAGLIAPSQSFAQNGVPIDILPAKSVQDKSLLPSEGSETHPPLKLSPDKSELIRLKRQAGSIIVGNPDSVSVLADSAKTLVLVPRLPGATHITVLDTEGEIMMQRHIIVASPKKQYIRVRRSCAGSDDDNCQPTQVYYCPDACHEVRVAQEVTEANDSPFDALEELVEQSSGQEQPNNDE